MKDLRMHFYKYDFFATPVPNFHFEGHQKVGSSIGFSLSVLLFTIIGVYTGIRSEIVATGARPTISSYTVQNER
jgi:hypothetical protein